MPKYVNTYVGPSRRASRLARGWAPWTCWASSAAHRWCRPGFPGQPAWTWPSAGWQWWCWAQKWRPWGTRRRWKCWPVGERCGTVKGWEGSVEQEIVFYFSKQQRKNLQWKSFLSSYSAGFGFWRIIAQRENSTTTDMHSFTWVNTQKRQIHSHPVLLSSLFQCSSLPEMSQPKHAIDIFPSWTAGCFLAFTVHSTTPK